MFHSLSFKIFLFLDVSICTFLKPIYKNELVSWWFQTIWYYSLVQSIHHKLKRSASNVEESRLFFRESLFRFKTLSTVFFLFLRVKMKMQTFHISGYFSQLLCIFSITKIKILEIRTINSNISKEFVKLFLRLSLRFLRALSSSSAAAVVSLIDWVVTKFFFPLHHVLELYTEWSSLHDDGFRNEKLHRTFHYSGNFHAEEWHNRIGSWKRH